MPRRETLPAVTGPDGRAPVAHMQAAVVRRLGTAARASEPPVRAVSACTTVLLCSTHPLLRAGLRAILEEQPDMRVLGDVKGNGVAEVTSGRLRPDVVVLDAHGPADRDAAVVRSIVAAPGRAIQVVVVVETGADVRHILGLLQAGASGLLLDDDPVPQLAQAIRAVADGQALLTPTVTRRLLDSYLRTLMPPPPPEAAALAGLSPREREIFGLLARGLSNAEIARHLSISERTVKFHVSNLLAKLDLRDRVQAAVLAGTIGD